MRGIPGGIIDPDRCRCGAVGLEPLKEENCVLVGCNHCGMCGFWGSMVWYWVPSATQALQELRAFATLRNRREAQASRLNWWWQENSGYDPDRPRNLKIHWCGCPNVKGWWMSGLDDMWFQDRESTLDSYDAATGELLSKGDKPFPFVVEQHNKHARRNRNRLLRQQRRAGMPKPKFQKV